MRLGLWSSVAIVLLFSVLLVVFDEYVVRPWRRRRWERRAERGDETARELLEIARRVRVQEE